MLWSSSSPRSLQPPSFLSSVWLLQLYRLYDHLSLGNGSDQKTTRDILVGCLAAGLAATLLHYILTESLWWANVDQTSSATPTYLPPPDRRRWLREVPQFRSCMPSSPRGFAGKARQEKVLKCKRCRGYIVASQIGPDWSMLIGSKYSGTRDTMTTSTRLAYEYRTLVVLSRRW